MNTTTLLKLASNPFYKLSEEQLKQLEEYRNSKVKHSTQFKRHDTKIKIHDPKMPQEPIHE